MVRRLCVDGYSIPRFRVYRAVRASPGTVAAVLSDPVAFADRLPLTFGVEIVGLLPEDPARGRQDVQAHAVRMRYFLLPPFVVEDYTLRFVAGPYRRTSPGGETTFPATEQNSIALKWTRLDSRIARRLDGSARFEPLAEGLLLLRYDTFVAMRAHDPDARTSRAVAVAQAVGAVVRRVDRVMERAQRVLDADPDTLRGPRRRQRLRLDALVQAAAEIGAVVDTFPEDDPLLLGFERPWQKTP